MSGHTPGPWQPGCSDNLNWEVNGPDGGICDVWSGLVPDNGKANAYLIAAAPRMFDLLAEARRTLEMWKDVAPAVSLCADIDKTLSEAAGGAV